MRWNIYMGDSMPVIQIRMVCDEISLDLNNLGLTPALNTPITNFNIIIQGTDPIHSDPKKKKKIRRLLIKN